MKYFLPVSVLVVGAVGYGMYAGWHEAHEPVVARSTAPAVNIGDATSNPLQVQRSPMTDQKKVPPARNNKPAGVDLNVPKNYQFAKTTVAPNVSSTEELRKQYSANDLRVIDAFYDKFPVAIQAFKTPEQWSWIVRNGYPLPDDIIAANKMSDDELAKLVLAGNEKASFLYMERMLKNAGTDSDKMKNSDLSDNNSYAGRYSTAKQNIYKSNSPFIGYMIAKEETSNEGDAASQRYIGYAIAGMLGDTRADLLFPRGATVNAGSLAAGISTQVRMLTRANPSLFSSKRDSFPDLYAAGIAF